MIRTRRVCSPNHNESVDYYWRKDAAAGGGSQLGRGAGERGVGDGSLPKAIHSQSSSKELWEGKER